MTDTKQINFKIQQNFYDIANDYCEQYGYSNIQELLRESLREKVFGNEKISGKFTSKASEKTLSKNWLNEEEDKAWEHLQKGQ
jgi:hypothetical protein